MKEPHQTAVGSRDESVRPNTSLELARPEQSIKTQVAALRDARPCRTAPGQSRLSARP
jgi:hypothetical protein